MQERTVSIHFCGGCNPRIDRGAIAKEVKQCLIELGYTVSFNTGDVNFVIFLSGCTASCAQRYSSSDIPHVVVAQLTIDSITIQQSKIVAEIVMKVRNYFEQLEKFLST